MQRINLEFEDDVAAQDFVEAMLKVESHGRPFVPKEARLYEVQKLEPGSNEIWITRMRFGRKTNGPLPQEP